MNREYDPRDLRAQEAAEAIDADAKRLQLKIEEDDFQWLMSDKRGRRFMWRTLEITGVFRNPYLGKREDTDFRCGEMNVGQKLLAQIERLCPEKYHLMVKEQQKHARSD